MVCPGGNFAAGFLRFPLPPDYYLFAFWLPLGFHMPCNMIHLSLVMAKSFALFFNGTSRWTPSPPPSFTCLVFAALLSNLFFFTLNGFIIFLSISSLFSCILSRLFQPVFLVFCFRGVSGHVLCLATCPYLQLQLLSVCCYYCCIFAGVCV